MCSLDVQTLARLRETSLMSCHLYSACNMCSFPPHLCPFQDQPGPPQPLSSMMFQSPGQSVASDPSPSLILVPQGTRDTERQRDWCEGWLLPLLGRAQQACEGGKESHRQAAEEDGLSPLSALTLGEGQCRPRALSALSCLGLQMVPRCFSFSVGA